jgi:hypothetical protein
MSFYCQVHKDQKAPMLMSGCKVADGYGSMLVSITWLGIPIMKSSACCFYIA